MLLSKDTSMPLCLTQYTYHRLPEQVAPPPSYEACCLASLVTSIADLILPLPVLQGLPIHISFHCDRNMGMHTVTQQVHIQLHAFYASHYVASRHGYHRVKQPVFGTAVLKRIYDFPTTPQSTSHTRLCIREKNMPECQNKILCICTFHSGTRD